MQGPASTPASDGPASSRFSEEQAKAKAARRRDTLRTLSLGACTFTSRAHFRALFRSRAEEDEFFGETHGDVTEEQRSQRHRRFHLCADRGEGQSDDEDDGD